MASGTTAYGHRQRLLLQGEDVPSRASSWGWEICQPEANERVLGSEAAALTRERMAISLAAPVGLR